MAEDSTVLERVQELTWSLVDEQVSDDEMALLDNLLLSDDKARKCYVDCVQLHAALMEHYAAETPAASGATQSPVLGFLNAGTPPIGLDIPSPGDAAN